MFIAAALFVLSPQATFAQAAPTPSETPVFQLPTTCRDVPPVEEEPENTWSPLTVAAVLSNGTATLNWAWEKPIATDTTATFEGYGYALYNGETLVTNGELDADLQQYTYAPPADGTYRLYVWVLDTTKDPVTPVATGCEYVDTIRDTVGPVIAGEGYVLTDNKAVPNLTTQEGGVTYAWTVNAADTQVQISNPTELAPTFTFLADGTYVLTLVATDAFGNSTTKELSIAYEKPVIPGRGTQLPPVDPAPAVTETPALPIPVHVQPVATIKQAYQPATTTETYTTTAYVPTDDTVETTDTTKSADAAVTNTARTIETSTQGWLIFGVPWYLWLLGGAIIVTLVQWYRSGAYRDKPDDL